VVAKERNLEPFLQAELEFQDSVELVVLPRRSVSEPPGRLFKDRSLGPTPSMTDSGGLGGEEPRVCSLSDTNAIIRLLITPHKPHLYSVVGENKKRNNNKE
jgi:hypothetical protein